MARSRLIPGGETRIIGGPGKSRVLRSLPPKLPYAGNNRGEHPLGELRLESLSKKFDTVEAVKEVSLSIHDGEFVVLLGPSGCGKTTTLRMIAGLEEITGGKIYLDVRRPRRSPISPRRDLRSTGRPCLSSMAGQYRATTGTPGSRTPSMSADRRFGGYARISAPASAAAPR